MDSIPLRPSPGGLNINRLTLAEVGTAACRRRQLCPARKVMKPAACFDAFSGPNAWATPVTVLCRLCPIRV